MGRIILRLISAALLSTACYFGTVYWYESGKKDLNSNTDRSPIAVLQEHENEVQRKPLARVIWESISEGESLFPGEAIRTSNSSDARILFIKSGTVIELEPESLVVLEENENGIALDFLKGNLFVQSQGKAKGAQKGTAPQITLKSGQNEIKLNDANLSLSKSKKGKVELQVFKGTAEVQQGDKSIEVDKDKSGTLSEKGKVDLVEQSLKILSPLPGQPVYFDPNKKEPIEIQWEKLKPGYRVFFERGNRRSRLRRITTRSFPGEKGSFRIPPKAGKMFWRIVAVPANPELTELKSAIQSVQVIAKTPPILLEPGHKEKVVLNDNQKNIRMRWANPAKLTDLVLEVASDSKLKNKIVQKSVEADLTFTNLEIKKSGVYFWRMTGFMNIEGKKEPVSSRIYAFALKTGIDLIPPALKSPVKNQKLTFDQVREKGLYLSWESVPGIKDYKLFLESKSGVKEHKVSVSPYRVEKLPSGPYQWWMQSVSPDTGNTSSISEKRFFQINEIPKVEFLSGNEPETYFYYTKKPAMEIGWKKSQEQAYYWRYKVAYEDKNLDQVQWKMTRNTGVRTYVPQDGDYEVLVEALSANRQVIARSQIKTLTVRKKPLLPAPEFSHNLPEILKSDRRGLLELSWKPVNGAKKYQVVLKGSDGKVIREQVIDRSVASLPALKPGDYEVNVTAIDQHDRPGKESKFRKVEVPRTSNIKAPKLKTIEVK